MMYEHRSQPLLPRALFLRRLLRHGLIGIAVIVCSLAIGIVGYHVLAGFSWLNSLLDASMILGGMGPVNPLTTTAGKLFASFYALFAGIAFLATVGIFVAPIAHRLLHRLHLEKG
ncbi:MAG: hypothetical protein NTW97_01285 [Candidatus Krumholzibacteria bacterium]|nr:hypothetical protein [Candidatus Krumholzibacteria bacterium]